MTSLPLALQFVSSKFDTSLPTRFYGWNIIQNSIKWLWDEFDNNDKVQLIKQLKQTLSELGNAPKSLRDKACTVVTDVAKREIMGLWPEFDEWLQSLANQNPGCRYCVMSILLHLFDDVLVHQDELSQSRHEILSAYTLAISASEDDMRITYPDGHPIILAGTGLKWGQPGSQGWIRRLVGYIQAVRMPMQEDDLEDLYHIMKTLEVLCTTGLVETLRIESLRETVLHLVQSADDPRLRLYALSCVENILDFSRKNPKQQLASVNDYWNVNTLNILHGIYQNINLQVLEKSPDDEAFADDSKDEDDNYLCFLLERFADLWASLFRKANKLGLDMHAEAIALTLQLSDHPLTIISNEVYPCWLDVLSSKTTMAIKDDILILSLLESSAKSVYYPGCGETKSKYRSPVLSNYVGKCLSLVPHLVQLSPIACCKWFSERIAAYDELRLDAFRTKLQTKFGTTDSFAEFMTYCKLSQAYLRGLSNSKNESNSSHLSEEWKSTFFHAVESRANRDAIYKARYLQTAFHFVDSLGEELLGSLFQSSMELLLTSLDSEDSSTSRITLEAKYLISGTILGQVEKRPAYFREHYNAIKEISLKVLNTPQPMFIKLVLSNILFTIATNFDDPNLSESECKDILSPILAHWTSPVVKQVIQDTDHYLAALGLPELMKYLETRFSRQEGLGRLEIAELDAAGIALKEKASQVTEIEWPLQAFIFFISSATRSLGEEGPKSTNSMRLWSQAVPVIVPPLVVLLTTLEGLNAGPKSEHELRSYILTEITQDPVAWIRTTGVADSQSYDEDIRGSEDQNVASLISLFMRTVHKSRTLSFNVLSVLMGLGTCLFTDVSSVSDLLSPVFSRLSASSPIILLAKITQPFKKFFETLKKMPIDLQQAYLTEFVPGLLHIVSSELSNRWDNELATETSAQTQPGDSLSSLSLATLKFLQIIEAYLSGNARSQLETPEKATSMKDKKSVQLCLNSAFHDHRVFFQSLLEITSNGMSFPFNRGFLVSLAIMQQLLQSISLERQQEHGIAEEAVRHFFQLLLVNYNDPRRSEILPEILKSFMFIYEKFGNALNSPRAILLTLPNKNEAGVEAFHAEFFATNSTRSRKAAASQFLRDVKAVTHCTVLHILTN